MQHSDDNNTIPANLLSKIVVAVADAESLLSQPVQSTTVIDDKLSQKLKQSQNSKSKHSLEVVSATTKSYTSKTPS